MLDTIAPAARGSYEAYVEHITHCRACLPKRCFTGEELVRVYLADARKH